MFFGNRPLPFQLFWPLFGLVLLFSSGPGKSTPAHSEEIEEQPEDKTEEEPEVAPELVQAEKYQRQINKLTTFQTDHPATKAATEADTLIAGFRNLIEQEGERIYQQAMASADAQDRDRLLKLLEDPNGVFTVANTRLPQRAKRELDKRRVGLERTLYPTLEEAEQKQRELKAETEKNQAEADQKAAADLAELKTDLLTDSLSATVRRLAEEKAREELETAVRLVIPQRRVRLKEIIDLFPTTSAAQEAQAMLPTLGTWPTGRGTPHAPRFHAPRLLPAPCEGPVWIP